MNAKLGKIQRLSAVRVMGALPRSDIGKIMKRELRDAFQPSPGIAGALLRKSSSEAARPGAGGLPDQG